MLPIVTNLTNCLAGSISRCRQTVAGFNEADLTFEGDGSGAGALRAGPASIPARA